MGEGVSNKIIYVNLLSPAWSLGANTCICSFSVADIVLWGISGREENFPIELVHSVTAPGASSPLLLVQDLAS